MAPNSLVLRFAIGLIFLANFTLLAAAQETKTEEPAQPKEQKTVKSPRSLTEKASFLAGYQFMLNAKRQGIDFDVEQLCMGIKKGAEGQELDLDIEEIDAVNMAFRRLIVKRQQEKMEALAAENLKEGREFVEDYLKQTNVSKTEAGVPYKILQAGTGAQPKKEDLVRVHFKGTTLDGQTLISTIGREPAQLVVATQIPGFVSVIQEMKTGAKWEVVIPAELGFGKRGSRMAAPNQTIIYEIELLEIVDKTADAPNDEKKSDDGKKD